MKTKIKLLSILSLALCMIMSVAILTTACGSKIDYTTYTYEDYSNMTDEDWDAKTISYQFYVDYFMGGDGPLAFLFNLYEDGTMLIYQSGLYTSEAEDVHWYDEDGHIAWAHFGLWAESDTAVVLHYMSEKADAATTVSLDENWALDEEGTAATGCFIVSLGKTDSLPVLENGSFKYYGLNPNKPAFPAGITAVTATTGSSIRFTTLKAYVDETLKDEANFPVS